MPGRCANMAQQVALALGQLDGVLAALELAAPDVEREVAHRDLIARPGGALARA